MLLTRTLNQKQHLFISLNKKRLIYLTLHPFLFLLKFLVILIILWQIRSIFSLLLWVVPLLILPMILFLTKLLLLMTIILIIYMDLLTFIHVLIHFWCYFHLYFILIINRSFSFPLEINSSINPTLLGSDECLIPSTKYGINVLWLFKTYWRLYFLRLFYLINKFKITNIAFLDPNCPFSFFPHPYKVSSFFLFYITSSSSIINFCCIFGLVIPKEECM